VIFDEGSEGDKMYVVHSGGVTIERAGKVIEALSAGDIFGEMALIDGARRSATARAKTDESCCLRAACKRGKQVDTRD
jgi:CRP/FNR family transcriptional regulator, cyclic AMP receptor protein